MGTTTTTTTSTTTPKTTTTTTTTTKTPTTNEPKLVSISTMPTISTTSTKLSSTTTESTNPKTTTENGVSPRSPPLFANNKPVPFPSLSLQNGVIGSSDKDTSPAAVTSKVTTSFEVTIDYSRLEGSGGRNRSPPAVEQLPP